MRERPIIFSAAMVRALLAGTKSQTRRIMAPQPEPYAGGVHPNHVAKHPAPYIDAYCGARKTEANPRGMTQTWCWWTEDDRQGPGNFTCRYGVPGDRLWVRETFALPPGSDLVDDVVYRADLTDEQIRDEQTIRRRITKEAANMSQCGYDADADTGWRPSIYMPRRFSRITLELIEVRVERLQDISGADVRSEGVELPVAPCTERCRHAGRTDSTGHPLVDVMSPMLPSKDGPTWTEDDYWRAAYARLWESINGLGSWAANPWIWALGVRRLDASAERVCG